MSRKLLYFIPVIIWMIVIFSFSAQDASESSSLSNDVADTIYEPVVEAIPNADISRESFNITLRNLAHGVLYFMLGILLLNATINYRIGLFKSSSISLLASIIYALTDEIHQLFVPGRAFELKDIFIDSIGALLGIIVYITLITFIKPKLTIHK